MVVRCLIWGWFKVLLIVLLCGFLCAVLVVVFVICCRGRFVPNCLWAVSNYAW